MKHQISVISMAAGLTCMVSAPVFADPALYSSTSGTTTNLFTVNGQPNPSSNPNESGGEGNGDDFNTGYRVINVTGFSFYGGQTDANQSNYALAISFYTTTGVRISSINVSASDTYGIGMHTVNPSDFQQNGLNSLLVTGAGYVVFQPYYFSIQNANTGITTTAPTGTPQLQLGFGGVPTIGANNPTFSALTVTPGPGVLSTGAFATGAGPTGQYAQFEIDGTVAATSNTTTPLWAASGSGNWSDSSTWTQGVPNSTAATANFFEGITSNSTVTLVTGETVGTLNFDNPLYSYTLAGSSTLALSSNSGAATLNSWGGSHAISCPVAYSGGLNVTTFPDPSASSPSLTLPLSITASGTLVKSGTGTLAFAPSTTGITTLNLPALTIGSGTVALQSSGVISNRTLLVTSALTLNGGLLDLGANDALLTGAGASGLSTAFSEIQQGYAKGGWNGSAGITSSSAATNSRHLTALGVVFNDDGTGTNTPLVTKFDGISTGEGDVLIKYTYYGDANLDGQVDGSDYTKIDAGYNSQSTTHLTGWANGDFNYDGVIDGSDYTLIDNAFNTQGSTLSPAIATAQIAALYSGSPVPEPSAAMTLAAGAVGLLKRRRRGK